METLAKAFEISEVLFPDIHIFSFMVILKGFKDSLKHTAISLHDIFNVL